MTDEENLRGLVELAQEMDANAERKRAELIALMGGARAAGTPVPEIARATRYATSTVYQMLRGVDAAADPSAKDKLTNAALAYAEADRLLIKTMRDRDALIGHMRQTHPVDYVAEVVGLSPGRVAQIAPRHMDIAERMAKARAARRTEV